MNSPRRHVFILGLFGVLMMLPTATYPFGEDQAIFGYVARRMGEGAVLYRDVWDLKLGIYFVYEWVFRLLGDSMPAVRGFDIVWTVVTALALYACARECLSPLASLLGGAFYILLYADSSYWGMAQPDALANLPLAVALWSWQRSARRREGVSPRNRVMGEDVLAGFMLGFATSLRPTLLCAALCLPLVYWAHARLRSLAAAGIATLVGMLIAVAPFLLYFARHNALPDLWETLAVVNPKYWAAATSGSSFIEDAAIGIIVCVSHANHLALVCGVLGITYQVAQLRENRSAWIPLGFYLLTILNVAAQRKFFSYHWLPTFAPLAMLAGSAIELRRYLPSAGAGGKSSMVARSASRSPVLIGYALILVALTAEFAIRWAGEAVAFCAPKRSTTDWRRYYGRFGPEPGKTVTDVSFSFWTEREAAEYIAQRTATEDRIVVWGFSALVHFLSRRNAPSRFIDPRFVLWEGVPRAWLPSYMNVVKQERPIYVVVRHGDLVVDSQGRNQDPWLPLTAAPEMMKFVQDNYVIEKRIGYLTLFRRKSRA